MRQVAIFNEILTAYSNDMIHVEPEAMTSFNLNHTPVTCGLINASDTYFDGSLPENRHSVLVRKKAFSCNYRDKAMALSAKQQVDRFAEKNQAKFFTLGSEFVGEVVAIGSEVESLSLGDQVIGNGNYPYSDYEQARPGLPTNHGSKELEIFHFSKLIKVPDTMPVEVAASFPIGGQTVYSMIRKLNLQPGEKVLVTAATSNTSLFAINVLKQLPVSVYAITTRADFNQQLLDMGVEQVFVVERGLKSLLQDDTIASFVRQNGLFNAVIDPFFDIYLAPVVDVMAIEGRYITCGMYGQGNVGEAHEISKLNKNLDHIMGMAMMKNINLIGNCIGRTEDLANAIQDYADGKWEVVIDSIFQENQVNEFFERTFNSADRFGKVVYKYA